MKLQFHHVSAIVGAVIGKKNYDAHTHTHTHTHRGYEIAASDLRKLEEKG